jgi:hypothetical protein
MEMEKEREIKEKLKLSEDWLKDFYYEVGREVTLARESQKNAHNWVIALSTGIIAATWALGINDSFYPSEKSFLLLLLAIPLFFRFFVRSCLEYQNFNRWKEIRNALNVYFYTKDIHKEQNEKAMESLIENIQLYYFQWKQPESNWIMIKENLQLVFAWPFIVVLGLLIWGIIRQPFTPLIWIVLLTVLSWMFYEIYSFKKYFSNRYQELKSKINMKDF